MLSFLLLLAVGRVVAGELEARQRTVVPETCPQIAHYNPSKNSALFQSVVKDHFGNKEEQTKLFALLSGAVKIKTESFPNNGPIGEDPHWEVFPPFHDYLSSNFPQVYNSTTVTKVNTHGLLYEWKGSNADLKPILFLAHFDVVPVNPGTEEQWTHPPYAGHYDGERIWGRGASDDKGAVIGLLSSFEALLSAGFTPARTIILAFGFDEEVGGEQGAGKLADALLEKYGPNGIAFVVDEGPGIQRQFGIDFAPLGVTEKGVLDTRLEVRAPGGHSSIAPLHTSVGLLAAFLVEMENKPVPATLTRDDPFFDTLQCLGRYAPIPEDLRQLIAASRIDDNALALLQRTIAGANPLFRSLMATTTTINMVNGGVAVNALPENAWAATNHRIAIKGSVNHTIESLTAILKPVAERLNMAFTSFGTQLTFPSPTNSSGTVSLRENIVGRRGMDPLPISPYKKGQNAGAYNVLAGSIRTTYNVHRNLDSGSTEGDKFKVFPAYSTANTDTRHYLDLSDNIFRYNHIDQTAGLGNIHTVDEYLPADSFIEITRFFTTVILSADEWEGV